MEDLPIVTVMIATYNSEKLLDRTLAAIRGQTYVQTKVEILIVDGGSTDDTIKIAKKYQCITLQNDKIEPINAKLIGLKNASGRYFITIDHDEVIENPKSIEMKVYALMQNPECKVALCSGYKRPPNYSLISEYISEFGDPFSMFIYQFSKGYLFFERVLRKFYFIESENMDFLKVSFKNMKKQPIFELCCLGTMIDREYFLKIPGAYESSNIMIHFFYIMLEQKQESVIMLKNDPLLHYSSDSLKAYFPKLKWRICNNIHFKTMAESGFSGRTKFQKKIKFKKYLFIPYTVTCIMPVIHSLYLAYTRKNLSFLLHPMLCWYVLIQIIYQYSISIFCEKPKFMSYDGKKEIE